MSFFFFFNDTATTEIYTLSLHDALPIFVQVAHMRHRPACYLPIPFGAIVSRAYAATGPRHPRERRIESLPEGIRHPPDSAYRSEEHTSELQSQSNLVCRLLLEKKKKTRM